MKTNRKIIMVSALVLALAATTFAQTNLQFTSVNATPENAVQLFWTSTNHELYTIQFADALGTNADGSTTWNTLYHDYWPCLELVDSVGVRHETCFS